MFGVLVAILLSLTSVLSASSDDGTVRARVVFIGDIMIHDEQLETARNGELWDFKPQFRRVKPLFWDSLSVTSMEISTTKNPNRESTYKYPASGLAMTRARRLET
jgi:hypothetical protein